MMRSMTGFGHGESNSDTYRVSVETKTVNHRYGEVVVRVPKQFSQFEEKVRRILQEGLIRGRVDSFITIDRILARKYTVTVDKTLAMAYYYSLEEIASLIESDKHVAVETIAGFPDVLRVEEEADDPEEVLKLVESATRLSLQGVLEMRCTEGERLQRDLIHRIDRIAQVIDEITIQAPDMVETYREKLFERMRVLIPGNQLDEQRLLTEVVLYSERSSITEEVVRLRSHIEEFQTSFSDPEPVGRKLDFLIQEMNREANTVASKVTDTRIAHRVVEIKSELEKIREQVQNIE